MTVVTGTHPSDQLRGGDDSVPALRERLHRVSGGVQSRMWRWLPWGDPHAGLAPEGVHRPAGPTGPGSADSGPAGSGGPTRSLPTSRLVL